MTQPPDHVQTPFEEKCARYGRRFKARTFLPPLDIAMWPEDVRFDTDISDPEQFNEQFLESRVAASVLAFWTSMSCAPLIIGLFCLVMVVKVFLQGQEDSLIFFLLSIALLCLGIWYGFVTSKGTKIRFNRRAQLVHLPEKNGQTLSLPWCDIRGVLCQGSDIYSDFSSHMHLLFPRPPGKGFSTRKRIVSVRGELDRDDISHEAAVMRYEFLRRYMADGLDAIRPTKGILVKKPTDYSCSYFDYFRGPFIAAIWFPFHLIGGGPFLCAWAIDKVKNYRWPPEIEALCSPNATLSGFDTLPVATCTDIYYRYEKETRQIYYVDAAGKRVGNADSMGRPPVVQRQQLRRSPPRRNIS